MGHPEFETFAAEFVRAYWQTVKSDAFPMAPDEPVAETIEELLAEVSHEVIEPGSTHSDALSRLRMTNQSGDWWEFRFRRAAGRWVLVGAAARSLDPANPHDLLDDVDGPHFEPFLEHATRVANERH